MHNRLYTFQFSCRPCMRTAETNWNPMRWKTWASTISISFLNWKYCCIFLLRTRWSLIMHCRNYLDSLSHTGSKSRCTAQYSIDVQTINVKFLKVRCTYTRRRLNKRNTNTPKLIISTQNTQIACDASCNVFFLFFLSFSHTHALRILQQNYCEIQSVSFFVVILFGRSQSVWSISL